MAFLPSLLLAPLLQRVHVLELVVVALHNSSALGVDDFAFLLSTFIPCSIAAYGGLVVPTPFRRRVGVLLSAAPLFRTSVGVGCS